MDGMPEYYSPSFDPSTYIALKKTSQENLSEKDALTPNPLKKTSQDSSPNPLSKKVPKGDALKYALGEVAMCRSRPCHSPEGEPDHSKNHFNLARLGERTDMKYLDEALNLLKGPRRGELRLRVELRRGLRDWGDFYTCAEYRGSSYKLPQPCKVSFSDVAEIHMIWWRTHNVIAAPQEMPLVDRQDRKWWRFCEDARISSEKRECKRGRRADFAASEAEFEDALASFPWGDDAEQIEARLLVKQIGVRLRAARGGV